DLVVPVAVLDVPVHGLDAIGVRGWWRGCRRRVASHLAQHATQAGLNVPPHAARAQRGNGGEGSHGATDGLAFRDQAGITIHGTRIVASPRAALVPASARARRRMPARGARSGFVTGAAAQPRDAAVRGPAGGASLSRTGRRSSTSA